MLIYKGKNKNLCQFVSVCIPVTVNRSVPSQDWASASVSSQVLYFPPGTEFPPCGFLDLTQLFLRALDTSCFALGHGLMTRNLTPLPPWPWVLSLPGAFLIRLALSEYQNLLKPSLQSHSLSNIVPWMWSAIGWHTWLPSYLSDYNFNSLIENLEWFC